MSEIYNTTIPVCCIIGYRCVFIVPTVRQDKDSFATLITIDPDGSPVPTTISPSRSEGIRWLTFCTGRNAPSPVHLRQNNKAAVCLNSPTYHISLTGTAEVCTDPETCREMWYDGLANHFSGPDAPNLCVIRFATQRYSLFVDWESVKGKHPQEKIIKPFHNRILRIF